MQSLGFGRGFLLSGYCAYFDAAGKKQDFYPGLNATPRPHRGWRESEELRQTLEDAFCTGAFVNPITPEEEAMTPGITARLDADVAEVCAAVQ